MALPSIEAEDKRGAWQAPELGAEGHVAGARGRLGEIAFARDDADWAVFFACASLLLAGARHIGALGGERPLRGAGGPGGGGAGGCGGGGRG